jgi:hypothetical protein
MLDWLLKLLRPAKKAPPKSIPETGVRVIQDEKSIRVVGPGEAVSAINWDDIARVTIRTTDTGPFTTDLFWHLQNSEGKGPTVPMGAVGEHELLLAMQRRLDGFDNMAVVEAMGTSEKAEFVVWPVEENER